MAVVGGILGLRKGLEVSEDLERICSWEGQGQGQGKGKVYCQRLLFAFALLLCDGLSFTFSV